MVFAAGLKLRGELDTLAPWALFRADARGRRGPDAKKKKYTTSPGLNRIVSGWTACQIHRPK